MSICDEMRGLITPSTKMGHREPMTINAFASIINIFSKNWWDLERV
jgi:hypothetical protein